MVAKKIDLLAIVGPTASGKTSLAIEIAKKYGGEIISADSRAIYKKMDIGTAKPSKKEQQGVKHWGIDLVGPGEDFTVASFKEYSKDAIEGIRARNKQPILIGGSGLYIDSVLYDYSFAPSNPVLRSQLQNKSIEELQEIISNKHLSLPENYKNKRYLIRTIEIGKGEFNKKPLSGKTIVIGLYPGKEELKKRIEQRLENMIKDGVVDEIRDCAQNYGWGSTAMTGGIYRAFREYIEGEGDLSSAKERFIKSDISLAKRQMTWFKRNLGIFWFEDKDNALKWLKQKIEVKI